MSKNWKFYKGEKEIDNGCKKFLMREKKIRRKIEKSESGERIKDKK